MEVTVEREHLALPNTLFERIASLKPIARFVGMSDAAYQDCEPGVGATFVVNDIDLFNEDRESVETLWTVTVFDPPTRFRAESRDGGVLDFVLTPTAHGTHIAMTERDVPSAADHGIDRFIFRLVQLVPPIARRLALQDAEKNLGRL